MRPLAVQALLLGLEGLRFLGTPVNGRATEGPSESMLQRTVHAEGSHDAEPYGAPERASRRDAKRLHGERGSADQDVGNESSTVPVAVWTMMTQQPQR